MNWTKIDELPQADHEAKTINRNIHDLDKFREQVDTNTFRPVATFKPEDAENEALRREYMIRHDILSYLKNRKLPIETAERDVKTLYDLLKARDGHRGG